MGVVGHRVSSRLEPLGIRSRVPARQDKRAEGPDVVAARDAVPLTIQQSAGRAGQAIRGGAVDHQLVVSEQVNPGRWMQRDRVGERVVDCRDDPDLLAGMAVGAHRCQRVVIRVLGGCRVQCRAEGQDEFRRLGVETESLQGRDRGRCTDEVTCQGKLDWVTPALPATVNVPPGWRKTARAEEEVWPNEVTTMPSCPKDVSSCPEASYRASPKSGPADPTARIWPSG